MDASGVPEPRLEVVVVGVTDSEASERAREWAAHIVADGGTIHLVAAVRPTVELAVAAIQIDSSGLVSERGQMVAEIEHRLRGVIDSSGKEVETEIHVVEDIPADAILRVVEQVGADLVVLGAHEQVFEHPKLIGRTVTDVLHGSRVPIAIVGKRHVVNNTLGVLAPALIPGALSIGGAWGIAPLVALAGASLSYAGWQQRAAFGLPAHRYALAWHLC